MPRRCARGQAGSIGVWAVLAFTVVAAFMALAIDAGRSYASRGELQNGSDSAALAAAAQLDGTLQGISDASAAAQQFGQAHAAENVPISIDPAADVVLGSWDRATRTFTQIDGRTPADLRSIIAARVRDRRTLPVAFSGFLRAAATTSPGSEATAVGGGPCQAQCAFPGAFADCLLLAPDGSLSCDDRWYVLNNDWQDNLGLTSLVPGTPASVPNVKDALRACVPSSVDGGPVPVSNGNPVQSVFGGSLSFPFEVVAPVVHPESCMTAHYEKCTSSGGGSAATCANAKFVGDMPIVGYVSLVVCYVTGATVKSWPPADWGPTASSTAEQVALWNECGAAPTQADFPGLPDTQWPMFLKQTLFLKHRCHWEDPGDTEQVAGCQSFGIWMSRSRLVQ